MYPVGADWDNSQQGCMKLVTNMTETKEKTDSSKHSTVYNAPLYII